MPAVSKKQQKFFGIVRAIQKGEMAPTTPETAKAAADMKKGDVKKFASTKHKGLPEKKKIKEDKQINKIIKQLRKSVKSHKKQADTLEKKVKTLKESDFTNITTGNKVGQTFQHTSGATITLDGALGGKMMVPSQVTLSLPFGEGDITVDGPTESDFSLAGFTKPLDLKLQKNIADQSVEEINDRLDASQEASGAETAKVTEMKSSYEKFREGNPNLPSFDELTSDIKLPDIPKEGWTYDQYVEMQNAIKSAGAVAAEPIVKEIIAYGPTGTKIFIDKHGQRNTPIGLIDADSAITEAVQKALNALDAAWEAYNKVPDLTGDGSEKTSDTMTNATVGIGKDLSSEGIKLVGNILGTLGDSKIVRELKTFFDYLNNDLPNKITNEYFSKEHLKNLWSQGFINDKGNFAVDDYIIGSGQKLTYDPNTDTYSVKFNYDFSTNAEEMANHPGKYNNILGKIRAISGGRYGLDALGLPGLLVTAQKAKGFAKGVDGEISISREELLKINKTLPYMNDIMNPESDGFDTGHGYSSPPDWLTSWAKKSQFSGDLRSLWNNKTRTWNLGGKIVDNYGNPIKKPTTKSLETTSPKSKSERIKRVAKTKRQSLSLDEPIVRLSKKKKVNESKLSFKLIQQFREESNPRIPRKKGQPANSKKHSDLYTDENPKGTIHGLGFKNVDKAKASVSKIRNSSRSHAHKIQAAVAMEQRAREMGKTSEAAVYRKYINSMKKKTKRMNEKVEYTANEFEKLKKKIGSKKKHDIPSIEEGWSDKYKKSIDCNNPKGFSQKAHCQGRKKIKEEIQTNRKISFPEMQKRIRDAKEKRRNQRKESEKLYMDTKKKGVKFFDKKGAGRIRDGKKIYE